MDFKKYQNDAKSTSQIPRDQTVEDLIGRTIPLLGLAGETGELLSEYKKHLRDGSAHILFKDRVVEELGDLLWYISDLATKFDLDLDEIAEYNLQKVRERWQSSQSQNAPYCFDAKFEEDQSLPRQFEINIIEELVEDKAVVRVLFQGEQAGNDLTDNSHYPDGYRFHDVFHFSYAAILGWSPVTRSILKRKRKAEVNVDEVEDGGRAKAIEEGVAALVFSYAESHDLLKTVNEVDYSLLKTIAYMSQKLEVRACSSGDWEKAILQGYEVWRQVCDNHGGVIVGDIDKQTLTYRKT
jgi:NTP pyrophosphatase (non-canonical NTP hydrolase)